MIDKLPGTDLYVDMKQITAVWLFADQYEAYIYAAINGVNPQCVLKVIPLNGDDLLVRNRQMEIARNDLAAFAQFIAEKQK